MLMSNSWAHENIDILMKFNNTDSTPHLYRTYEHMKMSTCGQENERERERRGTKEHTGI